MKTTRMLPLNKIRLIFYCEKCYITQGNLTLEDSYRLNKDIKCPDCGEIMSLKSEAMIDPEIISIGLDKGNVVWISGLPKNTKLEVRKWTDKEDIVEVYESNGSVQ